jgi:proton-translocating NADH-quinone oxidoreductase chain M
MLNSALFYSFIIILVNLIFIGITPSYFQKFIKNFTLIMSCSLFILSLLIWIGFDKSSLQFQYMIYISWLSEFNIHLIFGIDGISLFFFLLTTLIFPFCILTTFNMPNIKLIIINLILLEFCLLIAFTVIDLFFFCLFFESLLIPMFFIILFWGTRERRIKALTYFFIYTIFGSIFLLIVLFILFFELQSTNFLILLTTAISFQKQKVIWICLFLVFAIKIPIFPFHIWLPEAHVEAPTVGSVILAGLLLKLGAYGMLRFLFLFKDAKYYFQPLINTLCLVSILYASLMAIRQLDLKRIIAYSSIAHMNFALLGFFSNNIYGLMGGTLIMISHGLVSSALFLLVGVIYERYHTRLIYYYGGLVQIMPIFTVFLFLFIISNFSFPGTSNFIGEILVLCSLGLAAQKYLLIWVSLLTIYTLIYSIFLFNRVSFGNIKIQYISLYQDITRSEFLILIPLCCLNIVIGICPNYLISTIYLSIKNIITISININYFEINKTSLNISINNFEINFVDSQQLDDQFINAI